MRRQGIDLMGNPITHVCVEHFGIGIGLTRGRNSISCVLCELLHLAHRGISSISVEYVPESILMKTWAPCLALFLQIILPHLTLGFSCICAFHPLPHGDFGSYLSCDLFRTFLQCRIICV